MKLKRPTVVALLSALVACSGDHGHHAAGRITVDTTPTTEILATALDGTIILGNASTATRLSNGDLVVADENDGDIALRVFDSTGMHLRDIGRKGQGPGEFESIGTLTRCGGDSLFVLDRSQSRVLVFSATGGLGRTTAVTPLVMLLCSTDGTTLGIGSILDYFRPTEQNAGRLQHLPVDLMSQGDTTRIYDSLPAIDPRFGGRFPAFAVAGNRAIIGLTDSAFAAAYGPDGEVLAPIRVSDDPTPQTQEGFERTLNSFFAQYPGLADQKASFAKLPHPDLAPAYFALYGSPDGTVWTQLSAPDDSTVHLRATDSLGTTIGDVTLPFPLTIFEVGNDYILGRRENEAGEQRVVVYRMGRREGGTTGRLADRAGD